MDFKYQIDSCPALESLYFRTLELTFIDTLQVLSQKMSFIVNSLQNKQICRCYLIPDPCAIPQPKYEGVILGGTFDYFHLGHQLLLLTAILLAQKRILVGVTGQQLLTKKKNKQLIQSIQIRMKEVKDYIKRIKPELEVEVVQINDPFGPAITRIDFDAIAVSAQTKCGADKINQIRIQKGMKQLAVQICPLITPTQNKTAKLSSTGIRQYILAKNKMKIQEIADYKNKWIQFNKDLSKFLKIQYNELYTQIWWNRLLQQYSEFWRFYHTNHHIFQLLTAFENQPLKSKLTEKQLMTLQIGIWFHDIQYIPIAKNNQEKSAETAIQFINGLCKESTEQIKQFAKIAQLAILATKAHKADTLQIKLLNDLDMSILDAPLSEYQQYATMIRYEYQPLVKDLYNQERAKFLKSLKKRQIFFQRKPTNMQTNIEWQLTKLGYGKGKEQF